MLRLFVFGFLFVVVLAIPACTFKLDAEKFSASGQAADAKAKQLPPATSAVYVPALSVYA